MSAESNVTFNEYHVTARHNALNDRRTAKVEAKTVRPFSMCPDKFYETSAGSTSYSCAVERSYRMRKLLEPSRHASFYRREIT